VIARAVIAHNGNTPPVIFVAFISVVFFTIPILLSGDQPGEYGNALVRLLKNIGVEM
jgi:hypothetical protein